MKAIRKEQADFATTESGAPLVEPGYLAASLAKMGDEQRSDCSNVLLFCDTHQILVPFIALNRQDFGGQILPPSRSYPGRWCHWPSPASLLTPYLVSMRVCTE